MSGNIEILTKDNSIDFFYRLSEGAVFKFDAANFLWEDVEILSKEQGKKIKQIDNAMYLYDVCGQFSGIVLLDIKNSASSIKDDEHIRLKGEINKAYERIESLEIQLGVRGSERLVRCEFCRQQIFPFQSKSITANEGQAHTECILSHDIKELEAALKHKNDTVRHWSEEAQKIAAENHDLIVKNRDLIETLASLKESLKEQTNLSIELKNQSDLNQKELQMIKTERESLKRDYVSGSVLNLEYLKATTRSIELLKRVRRILGTGEGNEYCPIPQVTLGGEIKEQLKGWCYPVYCDTIEQIAVLSELIAK